MKRRLGVAAKHRLWRKRLFATRRGLRNPALDTAKWWALKKRLFALRENRPPTVAEHKRNMARLTRKLVTVFADGIAAQINRPCILPLLLPTSQATGVTW